MRAFDPSEQESEDRHSVILATTAYMDSFYTRDLFPDPGRKAWEQVFSPRHEETCNTPQPPHSDGKIYPIFNKSNFSRLDIIRGLDQPIDTWLSPNYTIDDGFYDRIRPALVLATRLCNWTSEFFNVLLFGEFVCEGRKLIYNYRQNLKLGSQKFPEMMSNLCNIQFFTGYHQDSRADTYGSTYFGAYPRNCKPRMATTAVQLNTKFTTFFTHYHYDTFADHVKNVMIVSLAVTLVHELVHVWYVLRRMEIARLGNLPLCFAMKREPYFFGHEREPELGLSWELFAFRGMPELNYSGDGPYAQAKSLLLVPLRADSDNTEEVVVDSYVVDALLDKECWNMFARLLIGDLHVPYRSVIGRGFLERMKTVVTLIVFREKTGRLLSPEELVKAKEIVASYSAKQQQFAQAHSLDSASPKSASSTDTETSELTIVIEEEICSTSAESPTTPNTECSDYSDQWALCFEKAVSNPAYMAGRMANQKRIQKARLQVTTARDANGASAG